jgi:hypothetical protein
MLQRFPARGHFAVIMPGMMNRSESQATVKYGTGIRLAWLKLYGLKYDK